MKTTIHHIAPKDKSLWHPIWNKCYNTWINLYKDNNNITLKLWNDKEDINNLVKNNYSKEIYNIYKLFPAHIMKIDFARLCMLDKFNGIYSDMDVVVYHDFSDIIKLKNIWLLEAPFSEAAPIENALMINSSDNPSNFFSFCIEQSLNSYDDIFVKHGTKIKFPFSDPSNRMVIAKTAGPTLVYNSAVKYGLNNIGLLPGKLFNNHGMAYDPSFFTRHILTGMWGKEGYNSLKKEFKQNNHNCKSFNEFMKKTYISEVARYAYMNDVTFDNFDLYKDYTNGQFLR
jgi:hypothetical protein